MFCSRCGTQVPDDSAFCHECGAKIVGLERERRRAAGLGDAPPVPAAPVPRAARPPVRPAGGQPPAAVATAIVGIAAIVGAGLAALGCFLAWVDVLGVTANAFDFGFVMDSDGADGKDGLLILPVALAAAVIGGIHFQRQVGIARVALTALGIAVIGVAGYNFWKIIDQTDSLEYVGGGLYVTIAGGVVTLVAGLIAMTSANRRT